MRTVRQKVFRAYFYIKLFYNRCQSYTGIPSAFIEKFAIVSVFLKLYFKNIPTITIIAGGIILFAVMLLVGYIDVKRNIVNEEISFFNEFNPEIQKIVKQTSR